MPHIFLVGARASGKSTLGKLLAERLHLPYTDMDKAIEKELGASIADFVHQMGWEAFRAVESDVLAALCKKGGQVIATGGGVILAEENRHLLNTCGVTLYLKADAATLLQRLEKAPLHGQRPALSTLPQAQEMEKTLEQREPLYSASADAVLDAAAPLDALLAAALEALKNIQGANE